MDFVTPAGFRDILPEEALRRERITAAVRECFAEAGYTPIETPTLELLNVMQAAGHVPAAPYKMFDEAGDVLALRPDVTMQVARMAATRLRGQTPPFKFRYTQRVFRQQEGSAGSEFTQIGLENIGSSGPQADAEVIGLLVRALQLCGLPPQALVVALGTVAPLRALLEAAPAPDEWKHAVLAAYHASNFRELAELCAGEAAPSEYAAAIAALPYVRGGREAIDEARALAGPLGCAAGLDELEATYALLEDAGWTEALLIDFSIMTSFDYYTGIVFEAYVPGMGASVGGGGRYDHLMSAYAGDALPAAGFAFYLEQAMEAAQGASGGTEAPSALPCAGRSPRPLRVAVPKGSLNADTIRVLGLAGLDTTGLENPGRQLTITNGDVEFIIVRPTDAPVFVALGGADCGICGKDSIVEADANVVELVDLSYGGCTFVVAEPAGATPAVLQRYKTLGSIRVATKYPRITRAYYAAAGQQVDIVQLHGNIELAPMVGLAERIVDITATGTTLRENNLVVVDEVMPSTARFFANPAAYRTDPRVLALAENLKQIGDTECDE